MEPQFAATGGARCGGGTRVVWSVYNRGMIRRGLVALAVAAAVAGLGRSVARSVPPTPPLAVVDHRLVRVDARTLAPLPSSRIDVGSGGCASRMGGESCWSTPPWSFSPDLSVLALARNGRFGLRSLRLVDVRHMRVAADMRLPGAPVGGLAWLGRGRLLVIQEICCSERQRLLTVDVARRRVTSRRTIWGTVLHVGGTPRELVLLLAPSRGLGAAQLAVADPSGRLRLVRLGQIVAGVPHELGSGSTRRISVPGLAVDPVRRRAFIVQPGLVAQVDLRTLALSYHRLGPRAPAAHAKEATGALRTARWLGGGLLAISGADQDQARSRPAGVDLVDTRSWRLKTIDPSATELTVGGGFLLATGGSTSGLSAYGVDGRRRFRLFDGRRAWVDQIYGGRAYVGIFRADGRPEPLRVVDLSAGRAIGERAAPLPRLLLEGASGWWGP